MGLFNFLGKQDFDVASFEKELSLLSSRIQETQSRIDGLNKTKKTVQRYLTYYVAAFYILWIAYTMVMLGDDLRNQTSLMLLLIKALRSRVSIAVGLPVTTICVRYLLTILFDFFIKRQKNVLRVSLERRRNKLEDLKKRTNFDATQGIINRYGSRASAPQPLKVKPSIGARNESPVAQTENSQGGITNVSPTGNKPNQSMNKGISLKQDQRTLQDKLLDYIIGSDHNESVENRFALICERCFTHNGLAPPGCKDPSGVIFICRKCGCLNGRKALSHQSNSGILQTSTSSPSEELSQQPIIEEKASK